MLTEKQTKEDSLSLTFLSPTSDSPRLYPLVARRPYRSIPFLNVRIKGSQAGTDSHYTRSIGQVSDFVKGFGKKKSPRLTTAAGLNRNLYNGDEN